MPRSMKFVLSGALVALAVSFALNLVVLNYAASKAYGGHVAVSFNELQLVKEALALIRMQYVDPKKVEQNRLIYGAIEGMIAKLDDPYSRFMPPSNYKDMKEETGGRFGGLGMYIGEKNKRPAVIAPIPGTPADHAGVQAGDYIIKVDDRDVTKMPIDDIAKLLRGVPDTKVKVSFYREGEQKLRDLILSRAVIKTPGVTAGWVAEGIGYAHLQSFTATCADDLEQRVSWFEDHGMKAFILDLRFNPGGLLDAAVAVGKIFLSNVRIVTVKSRTGEETPYNAFGGSHRKWPLIVLVNGGSASASEIVSGAIKDNHRGLLLGNKTFGKGSVQTVLQLSDDSAMAITTAYYYTPSGVCIHKIGIEPHVKVDMPPYDEKLFKVYRKEADAFALMAMKDLDSQKGVLAVPSGDVQLRRAIDILKGSALLYEKLMQTGGVEAAKSAQTAQQPSSAPGAVPVPSATPNPSNVPSPAPASGGIIH